MGRVGGGGWGGVPVVDEGGERLCAQDETGGV